jgi:parvulin-like peptidyl-prolyl isomerase
MKRLQLIIIFVLIALFCISCGGNSSKEAAKNLNAKDAEQLMQEKINNQVILSINNTGYDNNDLKEFIKNRYSELTNTADNPRMTSRIFDSYVEHKLILFKANQEQIQLAKVEIENYLRNKNFPPESNINKAIIDAIKVQKYLYLKLYKDIEVTNEEIKEYYYINRNEFRKQADILLHQILVKDREQADNIRRRLLQNPRKFAEIAKKESLSREAEKGGEMGYFEKGTLPEDMEKYVFSLKRHAISPVVESPYGFHIFKVTQKRSKRLLYLNKVTPEIKSKITAEKQRAAYTDFLNRIQKELSVDIRFDQLFFTYQAVIKGETDDKIN